MDIFLTEALSGGAGANQHQAGIPKRKHRAYACTVMELASLTSRPPLSARLDHHLGVWCSLLQKDQECRKRVNNDR